MRANGELLLRRIDAGDRSLARTVPQALGEGAVAATHVEPSQPRRCQPIEERSPDKLTPSAHVVLVGGTVSEADLDQARSLAVVGSLALRAVPRVKLPEDDQMTRQRHLHEERWQPHIREGAGQQVRGTVGKLPEWHGRGERGNRDDVHQQSGPSRFQARIRLPRRRAMRSAARHPAAVR